MWVCIGGRYVGVPEALGMSSGYLGSLLMFYITSLWFVGVVSMLMLAVNLAIFATCIVCRGGEIECLRACLSLWA